MSIVGFNFTKMHAERKGVINGKVNVNNNVAIKKVEETEIPLGKISEKALKFMFEFSSKYDPDMAEIILNGEVLFMADKKSLDKILGEWKKTKKLPNEIMTEVLNHILAKSNIEALIISKEINLPPPIMMPRVQAKSK